MNTMKWIVLLGLCGWAIQANAEQVLTEAQAQANEANKARAMQSDKMSPRQKAELAKAAKADRNSSAGNHFLASNKRRQGVISLSSGVQYKIIKAGKGAKPTESSAIRCNYQGTLTDGTTFDQANEKTPVVLRVAGLVPGLKEAVKLMPAGSKWEVVIPPQLGYGEQGYKGVGPNAVLIFTIEVAGLI